MAPDTAVETGAPQLHLVSSDFQSEFLFRQLLEALPVAAYTCDAEGLITYFNPQAVDLWGRVPRLNHPDDRFCGSFKLFAADGSPMQHDRCWMALALEGRRQYNGQEVIIERPDGQRVVALAHASPFLDPSGNLLGAANVLIDISARKRAEDALRATHIKLAHKVIERTGELTELSRHLMRTAEVEKSKLASELHDDMGALLTVLSMRLSRLGERLPDDTTPGLREEHAQLMELIQTIVVSQRRVVAGLRPVLLDTFGFGIALRHFVEDWSKQTGIRTEIDIAPNAPPLPANAGLALFRVAQEALANIAKHANAYWVNVTVGGDAKRVTLCIDDDGVGIAAGVARLASSHGIIEMRERLLEFGGYVIVEAGPRGTGTRIQASMPR